MTHARLKMAPFFNFITVEDGFSWWAYIGTASGMHGAPPTYHQDYLLRITGPPVPVTARVLSTPQ
eukprot:6403876-Pyramimonas_sp.AAC.1